MYRHMLLLLGTFVLVWTWSASPAAVLAQMDVPERRCAELTACESGEINHAYTVQYESGCGANCSISFWVRDRDDGRVLVNVLGVPSATVGVRGFDREARPDVRVIGPRYEPGEPRCCPSAVLDTRYSWSEDQATLVVSEERVIPIQEADLDALRTDMLSQGYVLYFHDRP